MVMDCGGERERKKRRDNIIIVGLDSRRRYSKEDIEDWLKQDIEVEAEIEKVWRVRTNSGKFMLGAQCKEQKDKRLIMENKKKLGEKDIYIENDLTWKERKNRDRAWDKAREFKKKRGKAKVVGLRKVRTEQRTWTWSERKEKWFLDREIKLREGEWEERAREEAGKFQQSQQTLEEGEDKRRQRQAGSRGQR